MTGFVQMGHNYGLRFNPAKTVCVEFGNNPFTSLPNWNINGVPLAIKDEITVGMWELTLEISMDLHIEITELVPAQELSMDYMVLG